MPEAMPAPQFAELRQQNDVAQLGMWIFLSTEVLFFGGLFLLYDAYRFGYPVGFADAARHTNIVIGSINTAVLLTSSFAVAWAVVAAGRDDEGSLAAILLCVAALLGVTFLGLKAVEYLEEYREQLVPGVNFTFPGAEAGSVELFFVFYFIATGLHAVHLLIGISLLLIMARRAWRGDFSAAYANPLAVTALYWHFVDVVWIFLFALIYLPGRSGA
jgi:cytochrome c oxidase subunit 3